MSDERKLAVSLLQEFVTHLSKKGVTAGQITKYGVILTAGHLGARVSYDRPDIKGCGVVVSQEEFLRTPLEYLRNLRNGRLALVELRLADAIIVYITDIRPVDMRIHDVLAGLTEPGLDAVQGQFGVRD
jgi:ABC-type molybdate transport system substrate-binding protein